MVANRRERGGGGGGGFYERTKGTKKTKIYSIKSPYIRTKLVFKF